ncbi:MAG: hypothetical protein KY461_11475 [Actinobacteria bacterium]|nr:hypothetical protein [Actinomycetota bacterium]
MGHVLLIHWKRDEVASFSEPLRDAGWRVDTEHDDVEAAVRTAVELAPDVIVLSLQRDADRGRRFADLLSRSGGVGGVPVVAVDGDEDAVAAVRQAIPHLRDVEWSELPQTLRELVDVRTG